MSGPVATVVIPTYARPESAARAVDSALAQTLQPVEVVVVNDGGPRPYAAHVEDERLRVVDLATNVGYTGAKNAGIDAAEGEWITFLDDDDVLTDDALELAVGAADRSAFDPPIAVFGCLEFVSETGDHLGVVEPPTIARGAGWVLSDWDGSFQATNTLVAPTEAVRRAGGFDAEYRHWEHDDFLIRLNDVCAIQGVDRVLYRLTEHEGDRLTDNHGAAADALERTLDKHADRFATKPHRAAKWWGTAAVHHLRAGRWRPAVSASWRAFRLDPRRPKAVPQLGMALLGPHARRLYEPWRRWAHRASGGRYDRGT